MKAFKDTSYGDLTGKLGEGYIDVSSESLTSLKGSPKECSTFYCKWNNLTSLEGGPTKVEETYSCSENPHLETLEGGPTNVGGSFYVIKCPKLLDPLTEIIKYQIKANRYYFGEYSDFGITFSKIEKEFNQRAGLDKRVTRSSMRTLLGLDK